MKIIIILYLLFLHVFVGIVITKTDILAQVQYKLGYRVAKPELTPHYYRMLAYHKRVDKNILDKSIIFIGDSLTQGLAVSAISNKAVNFGIGQDTTVGVLNRIPFYRSIIKSKLVVIAIGINDFSRRNNTEILKNYLKMIDLIPENIPILFVAVLPINEVASGIIGINNRIKQLNAKLSNICKKSNRLHVLNMSKFILNNNGNLSPDYHIGDGLHLNSLGNKIWIIKLREFIQVII